MGTPTRIVIVGAGFAGATCARTLERALRSRRDVEIVLLDRHNYFVFTPLLVEAGTGSLHPRHAVVSIRAFLKRSRFVMAEVTAVDPAARQLRYRLEPGAPERALDYDHLVLALGSVTRLPPVPGLAEHGFELKSLADAVALRDRAIAMLELAEATDDDAQRRALLHVVVVGGNFSGVEVAGEFLAFLREASRRYARVRPSDCRVTLVELGDTILSALGGPLSRYAEKRLGKMGVDVITRHAVDAIGPAHAQLDDGRRLDTRTVIWCAGIAAPPPLWDGALPTDPQGWLLCEPDMRIRGQERVWGIGDCAVNVDAAGRTLPATAQSAVQEGAQLAGNLAALLRGDAARPLRYRDRGALAALGCRTGVAQVFGIKLSGFPAWFLWRTVYLSKMPGLGRKLRVTLDWTLDLLFRRDVVALGLHARHAHSAPGTRQAAAAGSEAARPPD